MGMASLGKGKERMKQLVQDFKTGKLLVGDFPAPALAKGIVLIENKASLISSGTERSTVQVGRAGLIGKARLRPDLVKQVLSNYKKEGLSATIKKVKTKLETLKALGYSSSGIVLASMDSENIFKPGDHVACSGQDFASHAEIVAVPQNLVSRLPAGLTFEEGAYTTLGAIALQGVRQANPKIGETVAVIGLGTIGQLACQILEANGCQVFAIDLDEFKIIKARESGIDYAYNRYDKGLQSAAEEFTSGRGFDQVIITASSPSNDPIELAGELARKKGKVIVVGAIKMDIPRDPNYYRKELDIKMACSYGPGRYDPVYESSGIDYPFAYVRWTEQRNMAAFLNLVKKKKVNTNVLTTHRFPIAKAADAFDLLLGNSANSALGILISYPESENKENRTIKIRKTDSKGVKIGFIGAGSFAQNYLIPNLTNAFLDTVVTTRGITAKNVADKFKFSKASTDPQEVICNDDITAVFIATHHETHGQFALQAIEKGKEVFLEKPLTIQREELDQFISLRSSQPRLMVGYNRRFSPSLKKIKEEINNDIVLANYCVNAGYIPNDSWIQDPEKGGGRILGEVCHFVDALQFITGSHPIQVYATAIQGNGELRQGNDVLTISLHFRNGSLGIITYAGYGDPSMPKERLEISSINRNWVLDDYKKITTYSGGKSKSITISGKGHAEEVREFQRSIASGAPMPIEYDSILYTSVTTFRILDSIFTGLPQTITLEV
jgi:polar amino acid transport system substrate-binding protein